MSLVSNDYRIDAFKADTITANKPDLDNLAIAPASNEYKAIKDGRNVR